MIDTFFRKKNTFISESNFGKFIYDIDVYRSLPKKEFFDKKLAIEALSFIFKTAKSIDIKIFLIFGTCLGAVRNKDFIDHDTDIDLGSYRKDKEKIIILIKDLIDKYDFKISKISFIEESITLIYHNIIIDIGLFHQKKNYYIYNNFYQNRMPKIHFDSLQKINFLGISCFIPFNVEGYLAYQYGKNWKTPVKEWDYFNKYISKELLVLLREMKLKIRLFIKKILNMRYFILVKLGLLHYNILKKLDIKNIRNIQKSGQGFCDTFIIKANRNIVLKVNNQSRFEYFKNDFKKVEPIYQFLEYKDRFLYEKKIFEKLNRLEVTVIDNSIIFPYIDSKSLDSYIDSELFWDFLKKAISLLKDNKISHGDFHIENILISKKSNKIILIDFEMIFSDYLSKKEQFYYDIYYLFAKLEYKYPKFFDDNFDKFKKFIIEIFSNSDIEQILKVADKTKKYFFSINGARVELFR